METQEQEVEAFRNWWRSNGKVVVIGIAIGLSGVIGWNWWQAQQQRAAEHASSMYSEVVSAAGTGDHQAALASAKAILEQFPDSGYAALAALVSSASAYQGGQSGEAQGQLNWAIQNAKIPQVQDLARLRLARILRSDGKFDEAEAKLAAVSGASFAPLVEEVRGDLAYDQKQTNVAIKAYRAALTHEQVNATSRRRIEIKLADLGVAGDEQ